MHNYSGTNHSHELWAFKSRQFIKITLQFSRPWFSAQLLNKILDALKLKKSTRVLQLDCRRLLRPGHNSLKGPQSHVGSLTSIPFYSRHLAPPGQLCCSRQALSRQAFFASPAFLRTRGSSVEPTTSNHPFDGCLRTSLARTLVRNPLDKYNSVTTASLPYLLSESPTIFSSQKPNPWISIFRAMQPARLAIS